MNLLRGIISIGIIIACILNWVDIETKVIIFSISGLTWISSTILLYASVVTAGYAFFNSYRNSNQNSWIYLTTGLYGVGVTIYIYLAIIGKFDLIYSFGPTNMSDEVAFKFGLGIYLTGLLSFLLFLTGFEKKDNREQEIRQHSEQLYGSMRQQSHPQSKGQEKLAKPNVQVWLKENPGKSINDYFSKYK
jgi:hypothetical protein